MTPVFGHGHLRLYLLSLLDESPRHGYELIQSLGDRFGGTYVPSAGTIYPRLGKLEEDGLVTKAVDGRKTVYAITATGRAEVPLSTFRHEIRSELRAQLVEHELMAETVAVLRRGLADVRAAVSASMHGSQS